MLPTHNFQFKAIYISGHDQILYSHNISNVDIVLKVEENSGGDHCSGWYDIPTRCLFYFFRCFNISS